MRWSHSCRRAKQQHDELESRRPNAIKLRETVTHLTNRLKESRAALTKSDADHATQMKELAKLEREVKDVLAAQAKFEAEYQKLLKEKDIVPEDQIDEYAFSAGV